MKTFFFFFQLKYWQWFNGCASLSALNLKFVAERGRRVWRMEATEGEILLAGQAKIWQLMFGLRTLWH